MAESLTNALMNFLSQNFGAEFSENFLHYIVIFLISLLPILELRGGMIAASILGVPLIPAMIVCFVGNVLPIPFILLFIRKIFKWLKTKKPFEKAISKLEIRAMRKSESVKKFREFGLFLFVATPLPGTGGWTGALIAALLDIRLKKSLPLIIAGVATADILMALISYGLVDVIKNLFV